MEADKGGSQLPYSYHSAENRSLVFRHLQKANTIFSQGLLEGLQNPGSLSLYNDSNASQPHLLQLL